MTKEVNSRYICIFSGFYLPHLGGVENYTFNLSKYLVKNNYNVIIVTSDYDNSSNHIIKESENITIIRLPVYKLFSHRYPIIRKNKIYYKLIDYLDNFNIKSIIVNTRFYLTSHVGAGYGKKRNIPVYLIEHGSNYVTTDNKFLDFFGNRYEDFLTWKIKKRIKGFYGVSKGAAQWLTNFGITASGVWYNSIDTEQVFPKKITHEGINFLYAGRIIKQKGVENILIAFKELEKKYNNIKLYIAGDGPELDDLKTKYQSENIFYLGKLNYDSLLNYYALCDVFIYPPLWPEGLPTSILEAGMMRCGFIGTNQLGISEVINNNNGILINSDENELHEAMERYILDNKLINIYADNLYVTVNNDFSWAKTIKTILNDINKF